ncbi:high affinity methionine permease [Moniliophthora roreri MCA 2997]|uniref:High affinity methionine permease n=1 Tax=Moniliophthora roreri (strain MCA 2997) TaxID=1381753 RepID=V2X416_MONRO|nr:high affinity methionine permease [Moniliophthora roreri MCA 2997]
MSESRQIIAYDLEDKKVLGEITTEDGNSTHDGLILGAPTEQVSPLGYHVDWLAVIFLNVSKMIGTGVFTTPGSILKGVGSVGLSLIYWVIGFLFAASFLSVYLEYLSYYPRRSGAEVAYLEKAYPRPRFFLPTTFAVQTVLLSFSSSNAIVLAKYLLTAAGAELTDWNVRGVAIGAYTVVILICGASTRWALRLSNFIGIVKVLLLVFVAITGLVVLGGNTPVENPGANFKDAFAGTSSSANGLANALVKVNFAYGGFENAFSVANEIKSPVKTIKRFAPVSLGLVFVLYFLANIAYFASVPKAEIVTSKELTASLFFAAVFRTPKAIIALNVMIAVSAFGMLLATTIGASRIVRECGRQGVLPFPRVWASTRPFNTPLAPLLLKYVLTIIIIIGPPQGDAFNFIVDLQSYPANVFNFLLVIGLFLVRRRRLAAGCGRPEFRAWNLILLFALAVSVYLLVLPWVPPEGGIYAGDVSFFYATYCIVGIGFLALSGLAYLLWIVVLPRLGGYHVRQVVDVLDDGAQTLRVVKVPNSEIAHWDATHDEHGAVIEGRHQNSSLEK